MPDERPTLAVIGAGRVGSTLTQTLLGRGYTVTAIYSRSPESAYQLAARLNSQVVPSPTEAALSAQLTFIAVPDDAIRSVCEALARDADLRGRAIVHTSGVSDMEVLAAAKAKGAWVGGLHPMLAIRDRDTDAQIAFSAPWIATEPDVTFGVEAQDEPLHTWLAEIVHALNGIALWLKPGQDRARYHAAGVIASNYMVTLFAEAIDLLRILQSDSTSDERAIRHILVHLVERTLRNLSEVAPAQALTGPIVRGDSGTLRKHLDALDQSDPQLAQLYRLLGLRTLRLAAEHGLDAGKLATMRLILEDGNAHDNSEYSKDERKS